MRRSTRLPAVALVALTALTPAVADRTAGTAAPQGLVVFSSFLPEYPLPDNIGVDRTFVVQQPGTSLALPADGTISPDGLRVASVRATSELWVSSVGGGNANRIAAAKAPISDVAWSNDGSRVAYVSGGVIWADSVHGSSPLEIFSAQGNVSLEGWATWSPDDTHLLVSVGYGLWLVAADGSAQAHIFEPATSPPWAAEGVWDFAWARKTGALALTIGTNAGCSPGIEEDCFDWYAETFDRSGKRIGRIAPAAEVAWSPDGRRITYTTGPFSLEPDQVTVETASADGSGARLVTRRVRKRSAGDCWQDPQWLDASTVVVEETTCQGYDGIYPEVALVALQGGRVAWRGNGRADTIEPGGSRIAYLRRVHGHSALFTVDLGHTPARITEVAGSAGPPTWSSDGRSLAFTVVGARYRDLYVLASNGRLQRVMRLPADRTLEPVWYASRLFYSTHLSLSPRPLLWVVRPDGTDLHLLPGSSGADDPAWSPDGSRIAFAYPTSIATIGASGGSVMRIVPGTAEWYMNPSWSPDGRRVTYTRTSYGIYVVDSSGGSGRLLVKGEDYIGTSSQAWSPDGKTIAYRDLGEVAVINADGTGAKTLLSCGCGAPAWSPDGSKLAFYCYSCAGGAAVAVVNVDGTDMRVLAANSTGSLGDYPDLEAPAWSPDGRELVFSGTSCTPDAQATDPSTVLPAICEISADGTGMRALTPAGVGAYAPSWGRTLQPGRTA